MQPLAAMLAPGSLNHIANIVKGYAIAIGVVFAIWFVWQWWQIRQKEAATERSSRAKGIWSRQLAVALQNPELAEPALGGLSSALETARYRMFVAGLLASADEILLLEPTEQWRDTVARHLAPHSSYLASAEFREAGLRDCSDVLRRLVARVAGS